MMRWPIVSRRERLRREAAGWLARLNGPYAARAREGFESWYRASPDHAAAYDRLSAVFAAAAHMAPESRADVAELQNARPSRLRLRFALAGAAAVCILVLAFTFLAAHTDAPAPQADARRVVFAASAGEVRRLMLLDGSHVVLSPGSELAVTLDGKERRLRLTRGEGRFTVAPESRPFIVAAGGTQVIARGTQFLVRLGEEGTVVSLAEGRVDVSYPTSTGRADRRVVRLTAGQSVIVPRADTSPAADIALPMATPRPVLIEFDNIRLAEAVERVNRQRDERIRLADPALGELRVTGAFRVGNVEDFARAVAAALDLDLERDADGRLWLHSRSGTTRR